MILFWIVLLPVLGGVAAWIAGRVKAALARWLSLAALGLDLVLVLGVWLGRFRDFAQGPPQRWVLELRWPWIARSLSHPSLALGGLAAAAAGAEPWEVLVNEHERDGLLTSEDMIQVMLAVAENPQRGAHWQPWLKRLAYKNSKL